MPGSVPIDPDVRPKPFVKWVGGKRQLIAELEQHVPAASKIGTYHEPFVGGGALFFHRCPERAVLSDTNERLIRTYRGVKNEVEDVIRLLAKFPHKKEFFLKKRQEPIDRRSDAEVAAWFIYLNKTGYNGLYRVNSKNLFNVPFGDYAKPKICDAPNLRACSRALANAEIRLQSFEAASAAAAAGDFVYFDPPYVPLSASSYFTSYTAEGFGDEQQVKLHDVALELKKRKVRVLLSNSSAPRVYELYRGRDFKVREVLASRHVNSNSEKRGKIAELVIY